jgi:phosphohistidine swiveling domain-containing protein
MPFRTEWDTEPNPVYDIWTSVNGSEVVPGVISPFTATAFNRYDYAGLVKLMATYPSGAAVEHFEPPASNFFGVFGGRLALNNGYSVAAVSALDPQIAQAILRQFFTGAAGGERFIADASPEDREAGYAEAVRQRAAAPDKLAARLDELMVERAGDRAARDRELPLADAWSRYLDVMDESMTDLLTTHYVVSVAAGEWQVRLGGVLQAGGLDPNAVVPLCSGLGEVESSKPAVALFDLATLARQHDDVRSLLESGDEAALDAALADPPSESWGRFADAFGDFLVRYGYRVQGEADPVNPDWSEQPAFALSQVRSMLALDDTDSPAASIDSARASRIALEDQLRASLSDDLRDAFDESREQAQHFTRLRELSKAVWVVSQRRARPAFVAIARALADEGLIGDEADASMITFGEMEGIVAGDAPTDLRARIERRRAQAVEAESYRLPDNWVGPAEPEARAPAAAADDLTGLGVSVGNGPVTGTARIIPSAEAGLARDIEPGDILVAPFTDAPWTPLFVVAGAVVVETGGVLSHAATVAREFNIPAIVMVKDATSLIGDGDTVTVDGAAGTVTVVTRAAVRAPHGGGA